MNKFYVLLIFKFSNNIFEKKLPDESCRNCGGTLIDYFKCIQCSKPTKMICVSCHTQTLEQFHSFCVNDKLLVPCILVNKIPNSFLEIMA